MPRQRGGHGDLPLEANINVTSLVDVAFTLLVIFIITAPILQGGVEVAVPRADVQPLTAQDDPFFVSVTADGRIFVEEDEWTLEEFREGIPGVLAAGGIDRVYLRGDSAAAYGPMLQVFTVIANAGVRPALVAEPWKGN
ncbi:MAG: biopolymer transporter ExbD [Longimicrobiales bacterium]|nr:biopolymer transporter ExbD [Longimicrobiales bacterium]